MALSKSMVMPFHRKTMALEKAQRWLAKTIKQTGQQHHYGPSSVSGKRDRLRPLGANEMETLDVHPGVDSMASGQLSVCNTLKLQHATIL